MTPTPSTPTPRPGPARSPTPSARRSTRSTPPAPTTRPPPTPTCSPGYETATTTAWPSGSPRTCPGPGTRATTPACNSRDGSNAKPNRCGCSPPDSTSRPPTTGRNRRSAGSNLPPRSKAAGAPWPPCNATAGSAPTSPAPATTDADPSTPSATPCPPTPGCHPKQHDPQGDPPDWLPGDRALPRHVYRLRAEAVQGREATDLVNAVLASLCTPDLDH